MSEILWNGNLAQVDPADNRNYTLRLGFTYATRSDTQIKGTSATDCLQPLYGVANRLTRVTVQAYANGVGWQTLRTYDLEQTTRLNYTANQQRLLLTGIVQRGKDGTTVLSRYDFGYNANDH
ncbi:MAG: hypothetical protein V9G12_10100 [Microthrixaceae bacterium]